MNCCKNLFLGCFSSKNKEESSKNSYEEDVVSIPYSEIDQEKKNSSLSIKFQTNNDLKKKKTNIYKEKPKTMVSIKKKEEFSQKKPIKIKSSTCCDEIFLEFFILNTEEKNKMTLNLISTKKFKKYELEETKIPFFGRKSKSKSKKDNTFILPQDSNLIPSKRALDKLNISPEIFIRMQKGDIYNSYKIGKVLGEGGFGKVYLAIHKKLSIFYKYRINYLNFL